MRLFAVTGLSGGFSCEPMQAPGDGTSLVSDLHSEGLFQLPRSSFGLHMLALLPVHGSRRTSELQECLEVEGTSEVWSGGMQVILQGSDLHRHLSCIIQDHGHTLRDTEIYHPWHGPRTMQTP